MNSSESWSDTFFRNPDHKKRSGVMQVFVEGGAHANARIHIRRSKRFGPYGPDLSIPSYRIDQSYGAGWHFEPVPPGEYQITAEADGVTPNSVNVKVRLGEAYRIAIVLKKKI